MTGTPRTVPVLLTPERAAKLLEEVVYERVLSFLDLDELYRFEQELWFALGECGIDEAAIADEAKAMIDRALARLADDPRRYASFEPPGRDPLGFDCPDCAEEARASVNRSPACEVP